MKTPGVPAFQVDFYELLDVPETADAQEIKLAYRRQAKKFHPDHNPGSAAAEERFKRILEAYRVLGDVVSYTMENLRRSYEQLDWATVNQVVDILLNSDRKYIAGFRGTACCARYMASKLLFLAPHVVPVLHADATAVESVLDITEQDCLFLYSFPRYSEINRTLMEIARGNGAKVILMTDRRTSPLASRADVVLIAQVAGLGFTNSYVAPLSLSEVILLAVSGRQDVTRTERFNRIDRFMEQEKLY